MSRLGAHEGKAELALGAPGRAVEELVRDAPNVLGLYAIHADPRVWLELGLGDPARPERFAKFGLRTRGTKARSGPGSCDAQGCREPA